MGCVPGDSACQADERPAHTVSLTKSYWLGRTEVTVGAFGRFATATGFKTTAETEGRGRAWTGDRWAWQDGASWRRPGFAQDERHPVAAATWPDAMAYCRWAGGRLPTEAEWERAARGGRDGALYAWGTSYSPRVDGRAQANVPDMSAKRAFHWNVFEGYDDGYVYTAPVGAFEANGFGLYDISGNTHEWVLDWYGNDCYSSSPLQDPRGPAAGSDRGIRGGSWSYYTTRLRLSARGSIRPADPIVNVGIRCAIDGAG